MFMYFCQINKFLEQSFLTQICLGLKCSKCVTSCDLCERLGVGRETSMLCAEIE